jgi:predicted nucleic-acid-binding Zn-ribbon protein
MDNFEAAWTLILRHQGEEFFQLEGKPFTYRVCGNTVVPSTTNRNLSRSQFEKAWERMPVEGPGALQDLQGPSYLYAILTDSRIWEPPFVPRFQFECPKCRTSWCTFSEIRSSSGAVTAHFDLDVSLFTAVSCKGCRFTEFYAGPLEGFKERFGLSENEWEASAPEP